MASDMISEVADNEFYSLAYHRFLADGKLMGSRCPSCGATHVPPKPICGRCGSCEMRLIEAGTKGKIAAYTVITVGSPLMVEEGYDREHPYATGVIELEGDGRVSARILGVDVMHPENIKIGTPVTAEFVQAEHGGEKKTFLAFRAQD
ncbi:MAG: Zn-ribbon domain-containing OB-fold protein [Chloroflexota bacterium]